MKWHAQTVRCSKAVVLRGYRQGNYADQSPYQALLLVLARGRTREVQGFLAKERLSKRDLAQLAVTCRRLGIKSLTTRRHGLRTEIAMPAISAESPPTFR